MLSASVLKNICIRIRLPMFGYVYNWLTTSPLKMNNKKKKLK